MHDVRLRAMVGLTLAAGLAGLTGCGASRGAPHTSATRTAFSAVAPRDAFTGSVVGGSGSFAGAHGSVRVDLHPSGESRTRKVTVIVAGRPCRGAQHCLALSGRLTGTLQREASSPDRGHVYALRVRGRLAPLGSTSASGHVMATGNIRVGRESLGLVFTTRHGTVELEARSGPVPGFTSP